VHYAIVNGAAQLAVQGPFYAVPLIVLIIVTPRENAFFYVAWTITTVVFLVVQGVGQALLVEGHRSGRLASQTRSALQFALALSAALFALCVVAALLVPTFYGAPYAQSTHLMVIMGAAVLPWALFSVVLSATRVRHSQWQNLTLSTIFAVSILVPAVLWVLWYGINGSAWAWLVGNVISALAALVVLLQLRRAPVPAATPADDMELLDNPEFL
jgi:O-antigen/teichoic acid export membrane protein